MESATRPWKSGVQDRLLSDETAIDDFSDSAGVPRGRVEFRDLPKVLRNVIGSASHHLGRGLSFAQHVTRHLADDFETHGLEGIDDLVHGIKSLLSFYERKLQ